MTAAASPGAHVAIGWFATQIPSISNADQKLVLLENRQKFAAGTASPDKTPVTAEALPALVESLVLPVKPPCIAYPVFTTIDELFARADPADCCSTTPAFTRSAMDAPPGTPQMIRLLTGVAVARPTT